MDSGPKIMYPLGRNPKSPKPGGIMTSANPLTEAEMRRVTRPRRALTEEQVRDARRSVREERETVSEVAKRLEVSYVTARDMLTGTTYKWVRDEDEQ